MQNQEKSYLQKCLLASMLLSLTACGSGNNADGTTSNTSEPSLGAAQSGIPKEVDTADSILVEAGEELSAIASTSNVAPEQTQVPNAVAVAPVIPEATAPPTPTIGAAEPVTVAPETVAPTPVVPVVVEPEPVAPVVVAPVVVEPEPVAPVVVAPVVVAPVVVAPVVVEPEPVVPVAVVPNNSPTAQPTIDTPVESTAPTNFKPNVIGTKAGDVVKILDNLPVSTAQLTTQQTSVNTRDGFVYTANIEPGPNGDAGGVDLRTIVRQGYQNENLDWVWNSTLIEDRTLHDEWHTAPSIATDKDGYIHIVYNMHNFPWQHKISTSPNSIDSFSFHGQEVSQAELDRLYYDNAASFPTLGKAEIPGNMVTYPAFFNDNVDDLYLTYRFAARPKRGHTQRTFSSGIVKFNTQNQTWSAIGAELDVTSEDHTPDSLAPDKPTVFAGEMGWTSYRPLLAFDSKNRMHVNWFWRKGTSGAHLTRPCYLIGDSNGQFRDVTGKTYTLPVQSDDCGNTSLSDNTSFFNIGYTAINSEDVLYMLFSPDGADRVLLHYDDTKNRWVSEESPYAATELFFDAQDNLWAISSGINIMRRNKGESNWEIVYSEGSRTHCLPRVELNQDKSVAYIHTQKCNSSDSVTIYALRLQ